MTACPAPCSSSTTNPARAPPCCTTSTFSRDGVSPPISNNFRSRTHGTISSRSRSTPVVSSRDSPSGSSTHSTTCSIGTIHVSSPAATPKPSIIASVSGRRSVNVVPRPSLVSIAIEPRSDSIARRTTSMPTPRPDISVTSLDVGRVELHVFAARDQSRVLAVRRREVAHRARVLPEQRADRHHPRAHDQLLQLALQLIDLPLDFDQEIVAARADDLLHASAQDRNLAGEIEHAVEFFDRQAQRAGVGQVF